MAERSSRALSTLIQLTGIILVATIVIASLGLGQGVGPIKLTVLALALGFLIVAPLAARWPAPGLGIASILFTVLGCFAIYVAIDTPVSLLDPIFKPTDKVALWELNNRYGYGHKAGAWARQGSREYNVRYTIGPDRCRRSHLAFDREREVLVLGDSFTFGKGVEDDQTFPWRLGEDHWTDYRVRNCAVNGWGTSHAYLRLEEWLETEETPALVLYAMIPGDVSRNYIRASWLKHVTGFHVEDDAESEAAGYHPHFEFEGGKLDFKGLIHLGQALPPSPELDAKEIELTKELIVGMGEMARAHGAEFALVVLPQGNRSRLPEEIVEDVVERGVHALDLSGKKADVYERDRHPKPHFQAKLAAWIAESSISELLP